MFKLLFTGLLIYLAYRFFLAPPTPIDRQGERRENLREPDKKNRKDDNDGEYVDYEEVKEP